MSMAMPVTSQRAPIQAPPRLSEDDRTFFREVKLRVHLTLQAVLLRALEVSGALDCYDSFDLSLQVRGKKIDGFEIRERPPLLSKESS